MKTITIVAVFLLVVWAGPIDAAEPLAQVDWAADPPAEATLVETDRDWRAARFVWEGEGPRAFALTRIEQPGITASQYAISGEVRYENVQAGSYLEMWNHLPGGQAFFSRTLAPTGPMASLAGSSGWRSFSLPAFLGDHPERPTALELNLVLTGPGVVEIGPLTLTEPGAEPGPFAGAGAWWGPQTAGLLGGLGGAALGILGALVGTLFAVGRARLVVTIFAVLGLAVGLGALALGGLAVAKSQPYAVYYPLLLVGGLATVFMLAVLLVAPRRYRMLELRRMRAMDAS